MYDVLIVGGGPGGFSAAVNIRARGGSCMIVSADIQSNPLARSPLVDNYIGMCGMSGLDILKKMKEDALRSGAEFRHGHVLSVAPFRDHFMIAVGNDVIEAKRVVLAIGAAIPKTIPGEQERVGRGVSYCATCDGMLYRDKRAVVIGNADDLSSEAELLSRIGVQVTVIASKRPLDLSPSIPFLQDTVQSIGDGSPLCVRTTSSDIECDVVFVLRNAAAPTTIVNGLTVDGNHIVIDERCRTNIPGLYAIGDCTGKPYQIAKAVAQGMVAAFDIIE